MGAFRFFDVPHRDSPIRRRTFGARKRSYGPLFPPPMPQFLATLLDHDRFVLTTHLRGDGDAVGSTLALKLFLESIGKSATVVAPDEVSSNMEWMPHIDAVSVYEGGLIQLKIIDGADALIVLDTNSANRIGGLADSFQHTASPRFLIDHHPDRESWFDHAYVRESASSTGELVYELITEYERTTGTDCMTRDIATLLYTAIMTDTGSFRFSNVGPAVHRAVADLIERGGIVPDEIHAALYDTRSLTSLRFLGLALERIDVRFDGRLGFLALSRRFMSDAGGERGDTEGLVNYILSIDGVRVAAFFLETDRGTKVSFRSQGDIPINRWAASFGGGGHRNAAGAFIKGYLDEVVDNVLESAPKYVGWLATGDTELAGEDELSAEDADYLSALTNTRSS